MASQPLKKVSADVSPTKLPINLGLNDGTYASERCAEVLRKYNSPLSFRHFPSKDNRELREVIARLAGVKLENVFVANGSGPLLKTCIPYIIEKKIKSSPMRMIKHLALKRGYPIITPRMTYFKVPHGAMRQGLTVEFLPIGPENGWRLSLDDLKAALERGDGLVYLSNPNNPTGNILATREQLIPFIERYPESTFFVDEAYADYIPETEYTRFADLVPRYPNLLVQRSLSFAHGLAAARVGYILASKDLITEFELKTTPHAVSELSSDLAIAALTDPEHLPFIQKETATQAAVLIDGINRHPGLEAFPTQANFVLARFTDGRKAQALHSELSQRGIKVKVFEPVEGESYDGYFRVTVGIAEENQLFLEQLDAILS